jgi:DNA polymerase-1
MKHKIILVDGHCALFRMFFGLPARIVDLNGNPIHAVVGFVGTLLRVAAMFEPTHLLVVFDTETESPRKEIDSNYKINRIKDWSILSPDKNPFTQLPYIQQSLDYLKWRHCEVLGVEADDVIAAYVRKYQVEHEIIVVSNDSDLLQLVGGNVKLYYPHGKKSILYTDGEVKNKFGVEPNLVPDFKALVGDTTDNIKGIVGIGKKTAQKLLASFGGIERILLEIDNINPKRLGTKIKENKELLLRNLSIIKLDKEIEFPFQVADFQITNESWRNKTMEIMKEIGLL